MATYNASVRNLIDAETSKMLSGWESGSIVDIPSGSTSPSPSLLTKCLMLEGKSGSPETVSFMSAQKRLEKNHVYYIRYYEYHTLTSDVGWSTDIYWPVVENGNAFSTKLGEANKWNMLSGIFTRRDWDAGEYDFRLDFNNSNVAGKAYFTGLMLIDLTASLGMGSADKNTKAWCDETFPYFVDGFDPGIEHLEIGDIVICNFSGKTVPLTLPKGDYKLECWGASGGASKDKDGVLFAEPANGGYSVGKFHVDSDTTIYMACGEAGNNDWKGAKKRTFNGGGRGGYCGTRRGYDVTVFPSGGGATHIATVDGQLSSLSNNKNSVLIVAGGGAQKGIDSGGSAHEDFQALNAFGGGDTAGRVGYRVQKRKAYDIKYLQDSSAGNQNAGGQGARVQLDLLKVRSGSAGSFGQGGDGSDAGTGNAYGPGGGGGWYGGGGGAATWELRLLYIYNVAIGASGGSGYVSPELKDAFTYTEEQAGYKSNPDPSGNGYIRITMTSRPQEVKISYERSPKLMIHGLLNDAERSALLKEKEKKLLKSAEEKYASGRSRELTEQEIEVIEKYNLNPDKELFTFKKDYYDKIKVIYDGRTLFNVLHNNATLLCSLDRMRSDIKLESDGLGDIATIKCKDLVMMSNIEIEVTSI